MRPDRPFWVGFVCWVLIISGTLGVMGTMEILGMDSFKAMASGFPYPAIVAEVILFGGLVAMVVCGICMYEGQGWARYVYLIAVIPLYIQRYLMHAMQQQAEAAQALTHPAPPHHDTLKYTLILHFIFYVLSIWILFTQRAERYFNPPLYIDD